MKKNRFIPYGYTMRNGKTIIADNEADIIRRIFEEYINGASLKDIAEELTEQKIPYTEKTDVWDKARISRIIENEKYTGADNYDPIIDDETYEIALAEKKSRQRNALYSERVEIMMIRDHVRCAKCGYPMIKKAFGSHSTEEKWICTNEECGCELKISDGELLGKITLLMNRLIDNDELMADYSKADIKNSPEISKIQAGIDNELEKADPDEKYIISAVKDMASQLYKEIQENEIITAQNMRRKTAFMNPRENFNSLYFKDIVSYITMNDDGKITVHTKLNTEID